MKTRLLFLLFCFWNTLVLAQTHVPVVLVIEDDETHKEIAGANVSIKETGYATKTTDGKGKVTFDNVPVGEIEYNVSKEGYQFMQGRVNVSSEVKSNTFKVPILKMPSPGDNKILVTGEVTDAEGRDVEKALVEVKIADVVRTVATDEGGNYSAEIVPNPKYPANQIRIEVKKDDCKKTEMVDLPRSNVVYRDFKLDCNDKSGETKPTAPFSGFLAEKTVEGIKLTVERFEQQGSTATFHFKLENMKAAESIKAIDTMADYFELIDQEGNGYRGTYVSVGNKEGKKADAKLVYNTPVKGLIQFDVGAIKVTKAALLKIRLRQMEFPLTNIQLK